MEREKSSPLGRLGKEIIGFRIKVYDQKDDRFHKGTVTSFRAGTYI